jgi:hypothetical protein
MRDRPVAPATESSSFAYYSLKFAQAGTYSLYYRWRADKAFTDKDPNSANSFRVPVDFGDLANDTNSTNFATASVNNAFAVPAANSYNVWGDSQTYTVTLDEVNAGVPLVFKIGTREAGMFLDRIVLSSIPSQLRTCISPRQPKPPERTTRSPSAASPMSPGTLSRPIRPPISPPGSSPPVG